MTSADTLAGIEYKTGLTNAFSDVAKFIPKLIVFLIILIVGYLIAKAISKLLAKLLQRVGFDSLVERGGVKQALAKSSYDAAGILAQLVFYAIMLFVLSTAFGVFGTNPISGYLAAIIAYLPKVFVAILIVIIAAAVAAGVKALVENTLGGLSYGAMLANVASVVVLTLGLIAALDQLGIAKNVVNAVLYATLAAVVGVVVVAVGGGGIQPMRTRWEQALDKYDEEKPKVRSQVQQVQQAPSPAEQAKQAKEQAQEKTTGEGASGATAVYDQYER